MIGFVNTFIAGWKCTTLLKVHVIIRKKRASIDQTHFAELFEGERKRRFFKPRCYDESMGVFKRIFLLRSFVQKGVRFYNFYNGNAFFRNNCNVSKQSRLFHICRSIRDRRTMQFPKEKKNVRSRIMKP